MSVPPFVPDDTSLLRLCAEFHRQHATVVNTPDGDNQALSAGMDARWLISDQIEEITASTLEGQRAKAVVALVLLKENYSSHSDGKSLDFAWAALRDVAGDKGVAS